MVTTGTSQQVNNGDNSFEFLVQTSITIVGTFLGCHWGAGSMWDVRWCRQAGSQDHCPPGPCHLFSLRTSQQVNNDDNSFEFLVQTNINSTLAEH